MVVVPVKVESSQRSRSSAFGATRSVTTPTSVSRKEIKKLIGQEVLIMSDIEPRCVSPLHVVEQGDEGVAMARHLMQKVGEAQKRRVSTTTRKRKSEGEERELRFWEGRGEEVLRRQIEEREVEIDWFLYTDASAKGIGAVLKDKKGETVWKMTERGDAEFERESSAMRELRAVEWATAKLRRELEGNIQVLVDSQAAVSILRRGSMKPELHAIAEKVWENLQRVGGSEFLWIPREQNCEADEASRNFDFDDWGVNERVFSLAQRLYPEPETSGVDVFDHIGRAKGMGFSWRSDFGGGEGLEANCTKRSRGRETTVCQRVGDAGGTSDATSHRRAEARAVRVESHVHGSSFLLYLVERGKKIGSSVMSKISAAYQVANEGFSKIGGTFVTDIIKMKRRLEIPMKKKPVETGERSGCLAGDPVVPRDAASVGGGEIKWDGVTQAGDLIEVVVEKAKNDQMALGRRSFFNYEPGSDADILMCRWRLRYKERACEYVFSNLEGSKRLTKQSISALASKMLKAIGKSGATHHGFRRAGANYLQAQGHSMDEIRCRGRWRSMEGLQRYLKDVSEAQGCRRAVKGVGGDADESESDEE
ncbi:unnamed protein product [Caenorhabditis sp. 36 PRJEB53466]|nr:unnamed protein product [Caenorhabditis sp. 36 PRJEB53466]